MSFFSGAATSTELTGEYSDFFSRSERPRVSFTKMMQKIKPVKVTAEKIQIEPYTFSALLIMNSNVNEIIVKLTNYDPIASPVAVSTQTSGVYRKANEP